MNPASTFSFDMSYCGPPPLPDELWQRWNFDPILLTVLALLAVVGATWMRHAEGPRRWAFGGAWVLSAVLFVSPLCALTVALFSARVGHHVLLAMVMAPMLALALPAPSLRRLPILPPLAVSSAILWFWHVPDFYVSAFISPALYWSMQASLLAGFAWFWRGLIWSEAPMAVGVAALSSAMQMGLLGALLVFAPQPLYAPHLVTTPAYGLSPLSDQQLGGLIMWVPANLPLMALVLWRLAGALGSGREARG